MKFELSVNPICECGLYMCAFKPPKEGLYYQCLNDHCEHYEVKYVAPMLELERLNHKPTEGEI